MGIGDWAQSPIPTPQIYIFNLKSKIIYIEHLKNKMSSEIDKRKYTREEYIYLSKLYTKAEEYKKVLEFIEEFIKLNPKLDREELDILSTKNW